MSEQQNHTSNGNNTNISAPQPASYSSPQHYPSPSMSGYAYPPGQGPEPAYRASPTGSNVSLPSLNLPPIRTVDGRQQSQQPPPQQQQQQQPQQQQQTQPQQGGQPANGPPLPLPINQQYYPGHTLPPPQHMNVTSDPNQHLRYPLPPPPDGRIMSGGRHKKEIKRRTKTGCLTCRKRRIKCDEAHPACRNCQKSKRECLGYDPIFKAQPGPTAIQPAPSASPNMQGTPATAVPYPPPPQGYVPAGSQPYQQASSAGAGSQRSSTEPYNHEYGAAIDPALEAAANSSTQPATYDGIHDLKRGLEEGNDGHRAKRTKVDELLSLRAVPPPPPPVIPKPLPPAQIEEIKQLYQNIYARDLDKFFETRWFTLRGCDHLLKDTRLCDQFIALIQRLYIGPSDPHYFAATAGTHSLEAKIIWDLMALARKVANTPNPTNGQIPYLEINDGVHDAAKRFEIFENLILGQYFDAKPEPEPEQHSSSDRNGTVFDEQLKSRERDFWRLIHTFLSIHDDEASSAREIDDTLAQCRGVLDSKENRDIIYSIVIARHLGARVAEFPNNLPQPTDNEENDESKKLYVAKTFIEASAGGKGTTQVFQRVCGMAVRSWTMMR